MRVEAFDLGIPTPLQSDLDLTVYVKNVNDHEPQFLVDEFAVNFTEHRSRKLIGRSLISFQKIEIIFSDLELGSEKITLYSSIRISDIDLSSWSFNF